MNNHGQNILYIILGLNSSPNYLFYSPMVLFFGYGITDYLKITYPQNKYITQIDMIRSNRGAIFQTKGILEIIYLVYNVVTIFMDTFSKVVRIFLLGQMLVMKYKINEEFKGSCRVVHAWIITKISGISILYVNYVKLTDMVYRYAAQ
jgi:hypothetical protein